MEATVLTLASASEHLAVAQHRASLLREALASSIAMCTSIDTSFGRPGGWQPSSGASLDLRKKLPGSGLVGTEGPSSLGG